MLQNGAPPDTFGALYCVLHIEFHGLNSRIDVLGLSYFGSWYKRNILQADWTGSKCLMSQAVGMLSPHTTV